MSWSVSAQGKPAEVKEWLQPQFAACEESVKHLPHEQHGVILAKAAVHNQLDFLIEHAPDKPVSVFANGSASVAPPDAVWRSYTQTSISVAQVYEEPREPVAEEVQAA